MDVNVNPLHALADAAGLQRHWRDVDGVDHVVSDDTLSRLLEALGHRVETGRQIAAALKKLAAQERALPALVTADAGQAIRLPSACSSAQLRLDDGEIASLEVRDGQPIAPDSPGYYNCSFDGVSARLAVAPAHCPLPPEGRGRPWGVSVQIPALRGSRASAFGNFGELAEAVGDLAQAGADAVAINPVHALFPGDGTRFSPYSPSSRRFLNAAMADPALAGLGSLPSDDGTDLIDWGQALPARFAQLRELFDALPSARRAEIIGEADEATRLHAIFDALDNHFRARGIRGWQNWPTRYRNPGNASVASFAAKYAEEVDFHLFTQAVARAGLAEIEKCAADAGMTIGLVGDLAVGVDPGGSDCWALGDIMLRGVTIGAPPDPLGPLGQDWALTSFSPEGLRRSGYGAWIAMIRAALAHCGGLRIDHAFGLARLWVIPEGGASGEGAYLTYPFTDLVRLLTLEAHLAGSFIVAEDLGTAPSGFSAAIAERHMLGMRVLWFQRAEDDGFIGAHDYDPLAVAMTGTHDTPTLAGWWSGRELDWADQLGRLPEGVDRARAEEIRDWDRGLLWSTIDGSHLRPAPDDPQRAVSAAIAHVARTPARLVLVPLEDLCGIVEQPNIPGTTTEHPNWKRRLDAPMAQMLATCDASERLDALDISRRAG